jgi:hypothetical protein
MNDMSRIKDLSFINSYHNLAPDDYCDRMIEAFDRIEKKNSGWSGIDSNGAGNRKDFSIFFEKETSWTFEGVKELSEETNRILDLGLKEYVNDHPSLAPIQYYSVVQKVQRTPPKGGFHVWHCEHSARSDDPYRILTWTIYLNDVPEGEGETEFLEYGVKVKPKKGTVCFFPASWTHTHRGNAVYTHDKYIATGWYYIVPNATPYLGDD